MTRSKNLFPRCETRSAPKSRRTRNFPMQKTPITKSEPDQHGHWGNFGGRYVPETLVPPLEELTHEFMRARADSNFWNEVNQLLRDYCGRPTALFHAERLTAHAGGAQ